MSASLLKSCHFLTVSCFFSTCDCMSIKQQCHMVVGLSVLLRHLSCFLTISHCFISKVLSLRYFSYSISQDCRIFANAPSLICEHYHHHHRLYRSGWILASSRMSLATSILGSCQPISAKQFPCIFLYLINPS